jgi:hypothetical protein
MVLYMLHNIGVQAAGYRARPAGIFKNLLFFFTQSGGFKKHLHIYLHYAAGRFFAHMLGNPQLGTCKLNPHILRLYTYGGYQAKAKRGSSQVGWRKPFPLTLVIGWGVGFYRSAAL